ncbi:MAG: LacI family DNA-binding transcriptional regulator [Brevinema sp.]
MTIKEISAITGFSTATVHRALNNPETVSETVRDKVHEVVKHISKKPNYLQQVYVVLPHINAFYTSFLVETIDSLSRYDIQVIPFICDDNAEKEADFLKNIAFSSRIGLIWNPYNRQADFPFLHRKKNKPLIVMFNHNIDAYVPELSIVRANIDASKIAVDTLLKAGMKSILFLTGPSRTAQERTDGFIEYMDLFPEIKTQIIQADFRSWQNSYQMLREHKPIFRQFDAVLSASEMISYGVLKILGEEKLSIPKDIRFMTFDYAPTFDALNLSMVHFSPNHIAQKTVQFLLEKSNNSEFAIQYHFMPQLHLLGSESFIPSEL